MHGRVWAPILLVALGCNEIDGSTPIVPSTPGVTCPTGEDGCAPPCSPSAPDGACVATDEYCNAGSCEPVPCGPDHPAGFCETATFCSVATTCIPDGTCIADGDCPAEHHCVTGGVCLPAGECVVDLDCGIQKCATAGVCIDLDACLEPPDCEPDELCGVFGHCLASGECEASLDCPPGELCMSGECETTAVTCSTNETTNLGCNEYELTCCPLGESCCAGRERCSSEGTCIHVEQCLGDEDCLTGYACVDFACQAQEPCGDGCVEGERCSQVGGCIPEHRCAHDLDCPSDAICTPSFECQVHPDAACAGCYGTVTRTTDSFPNVLLVVDRSAAMNACDASESTWWAAVRAGIEGVLGRYGDFVHFGQSAFPGGCSDATCADACAPQSCDCQEGDAAGAADPPTALANGDAMLERLGALSPGGERVIGATLRAIAAAPDQYGLANGARANAIVLITSGTAGPDDATVAGCDAQDHACKVDRAIDALAALEPAVRTYVVAVGVEGFEPTLSCHAVHGGTCGDVDECGATEEPCYRSATDSTTVALAVEGAVRELVPCRFGIPDSAAGVRVYADDGVELTGVAMDPDDGWYFDDGETISLRGAACDRVRSGQAAPVLIGCHLCE